MSGNNQAGRGTWPGASGSPGRFSNTPVPGAPPGQAAVCPGRDLTISTCKSHLADSAVRPGESRLRAQHQCQEVAPSWDSLARRGHLAMHGDRWAVTAGGRKGQHAASRHAADRLHRRVRPQPEEGSLVWTGAEEPDTSSRRCSLTRGGGLHPIKTLTGSLGVRGREVSAEACGILTVCMDSPDTRASWLGPASTPEATFVFHRGDGEATPATAGGCWKGTEPEEAMELPG